MSLCNTSLCRLRFFLFCVIAVSGFLLDWGTKNWIFSKLTKATEENANVWWFWEGVFGFQLILNKGALFGMGYGLVFLFAIFSSVALVGILAWMYFQGSKSWFMTIVLGMITGGILGNLYDRLGLHNLREPEGTPIYAVRDWILVMIGKYPWPNFNVADSLLVVGAILLGFYVFFFVEQKSPTS